MSNEFGVAFKETLNRTLCPEACFVPQCVDCSRGVGAGWEAGYKQVEGEGGLDGVRVETQGPFSTPSTL